MADQEVLNVEKRDTRGSGQAKRLRREGKIPAILYGHGKESLSLAIDEVEFATALKHNARLVELKGGASDTAMLKKVQWDSFYKTVLHVDFLRTDPNAKVEVKLRLEIRGVAPGTKMGGVVEQLVRTIRFECPANAIPEALELSVNELELDATLTAGDIPLPTGASLIDDSAMPVVSCHEPTVKADEEDETAAAADGAEPEVIGGGSEEGEGGDS